MPHKKSTYARVVGSYTPSRLSPLAAGMTPPGCSSNPWSFAVWTKKSVSRLTLAREKVRTGRASTSVRERSGEEEVGGEVGRGSRERRSEAYCR